MLFQWQTPNALACGIPPPSCYQPQAQGIVPTDATYVAALSGFEGPHGASTTHMDKCERAFAAIAKTGPSSNTKLRQRQAVAYAHADMWQEALDLFGSVVSYVDGSTQHGGAPAVSYSGVHTFYHVFVLRRNVVNLRPICACASEMCWARAQQCVQAFRRITKVKYSFFGAKGPPPQCSKFRDRRQTLSLNAHPPTFVLRLCVVLALFSTQNACTSNTFLLVYF